MHLRPVKLVVSALGLAAVLGVALPARAQETVHFSSPGKGSADGKEESPATPNHVLPSTFNAPGSLFGDPSFDEPPPLPMRLNFNAHQQQANADRKNWALLTPEEIFGLPTPEKMMGISDTLEESKLSPEERFMRRQQRESDIRATNSVRLSTSSAWGTDARPNDLTGFQGARRVDGDMDSARMFNPFLGKPNVPAGANQATDAAWANPFNALPATPAHTPEQLAGMDRFRAFMGSPAGAKAAPATAFNVQAAAPDPNMQPQPAFNPAGASVKPLETIFGRPTGLSPLPTISLPPPAPKKVSLVQPPPWTVQGTANSVLPQRQF